MDCPFHILLADNHPGFCREMKKILEEIPGVKVTGAAGNRSELFERLRQSPAQLVLLDICLPGLRAREGIQLIKFSYPETQVLLTVLDQENEYLSYGLAAGAAGVLQKQYVGGQIAPAIAAVRQGRFYVPPYTPEKKLLAKYGPEGAEAWPAGTTSR